MRRGLRIACGVVLVSLVLLVTIWWILTPRRASTNFDNYPALAASVGKAQKVELHEGLPHQVLEEPALKVEQRSKPTTSLYGYPFYADAIDLKPEDATELTKLFTDPSSFHPINTAKKCTEADFHPDYAIKWRTDNGDVDCLVCFGCGEVWVFGSLSDLRCDFTRESANKFKAILGSYRKNRPVSEID